MNYHPSYQNDYPVYPGEYMPLPEVQAELEELQLSKKYLPLNPLLNIDEFDDCYKIIAVIPGVSREDIFIDVQSNHLSIIVLHKDGKEGGKKSKIHEFDGKYYQRKIVLPYNADALFASSEYKEGILEIHVPKSKFPLKAFNSRLVTY